MRRILRIFIFVFSSISFYIFTQLFAHMEDYHIIASVIKKRRLELSLSQQDLSEMSEVALRTINALETGKASVNLKNLTVIADVLGLELNLELKKLQTDNETGM